MKKIRKSKNGMVFTIDALLALLIAATIFATIFFYMNQVNQLQFDDQNLGIFGMNSLSLLEKDQTLHTTLATENITELKLFLNSTEHQFCANVSLYDGVGDWQQSIVKDGCNHSDLSTIVQRSFISKHYDVYYATMEVWFNEG